LRVALLPLIGQLWLADAIAQQGPSASPRDTVPVLELTEQPFARILTSVHELNRLGIPGGLADLRVLYPLDSAPGAVGERVFIILRPFSRPRTPRVFELPPIPNVTVHNTRGDAQRQTLVIEYGRGDTLVTRRTIYVLDTHHVRVQEEPIPDRR